MSRARLLLAATPIILWLVAVALVTTASLDPDQYFRYSFQEEEPFVYPLGAVLGILGIMLVELAALYATIWPRGGKLSLTRLFIGLFLFCLWSAFCLQLVMHMPGYILNHHLWVLFASLGLALFFLTVVAFRGYRALRKPGDTGPTEAIRPTEDQSSQAASIASPKKGS